MFDYLQQFNKLPQDLRTRVSSPTTMAAISELEKKYGLELAITVMKVMTKNIAIAKLNFYLSEEFDLPADKAAELAREMKEKIFFAVADYLGLSSERRALDLNRDIELIIKDAGLTLSSEVLINRFKNILATYLRGVRDKIDTRNSLSKNIKIGGLELSPEEIDRVMKICATNKFSGLDKSSSLDRGDVSFSSEQGRSPVAGAPSLSVSRPSSERLEKIIKSADGAGGYDLKKEVAAGRIKAPAVIGRKLDTSHELEAPDKEISAGHEISAPLKRPGLPSPEVRSGSVSEDKSSSPEPSSPALDKKDSAPLSAGGYLRGSSLEPLASQTSDIRPSLSPKPAPSPSYNLDDLKTTLKPAGDSSQTIVAPPRKKGLFSFLSKKPKPAAQVVSQTKQPSANQNLSVRSQTPIRPPVPPLEKTPLVSRDNPLSPQTAPRSLEQPSVDIKKPTPPPTPPQVSPRPAVNRPAASVSARPRIHDIKPMPKVMGPLEELQFIDLLNFRRLGDDPKLAAGKIFTKIKLLEKDGYDKMIAGIKAWRQSPLNRLYLSLGQAAVAAGRPLSEILEERRQQEGESLTEAELQAIVSLNGKLIF